MISVGTFTLSKESNSSMKTSEDLPRKLVKPYKSSLNTLPIIEEKRFDKALPQLPLDRFNKPEDIIKQHYNSLASREMSAMFRDARDLEASVNPDYDSPIEHDLRFETLRKAGFTRKQIYWLEITNNQPFLSMEQKRKIQLLQEGWTMEQIEEIKPIPTVRPLETLEATQLPKKDRSIFNWFKRSVAEENIIRSNTDSTGKTLVANTSVVHEPIRPKNPLTKDQVDKRFLMDIPHRSKWYNFEDESLFERTHKRFKSWLRKNK